MDKLPTHNSLFRAVWAGDAAFSTLVFETWEMMKRAGSAYSAFLHKRFKISGLARMIIDFFDDLFSLGTALAFVLLAYALPPFSGTGDWWNRGREYAVTFTDANGEVIGQRGIRQDDAIPLEDIPPHLIQAVLATEDARFFEHFGVDVVGTLRAIVSNAKAGGTVQGGSSITQQVAKNLFLSPERTMRRKVHEAFLSMWIEARLSKEEILKLYLDRSYLGGGAYGVEAASQFYFGKSVRDINLIESATLAGLFKAPTNYAPHQNPEAAKARSNVVLYRMLDAGFITQGELLQARRITPTIQVAKSASAPDWFLDWAYEDTLAVLTENDLQSEYVIEVKTTVDRTLQDESQKVINEYIALEGTLGKFNQASSVTMAPDGAVRAIIGGRNYDDSQFNRATSAKRQPGSAFKPFVYLAALLDGFTADQVLVDGPVSVGNWSPKNYSGGFAGRTTLSNALAHSYNSIPVKLSIVTGRKAIVDVAHRVGIQSELETWAPMVLGTSAMTLMDITTGFATFAGGGKLASPYAVLEIKRPTGDVIYNRATTVAAPEQVVPEEKIAELNSMLSAVVKSGTARRADLLTSPQGGKTGTNQSYRDAWYVGFTAHNVTGVWVGNDDFSPMNEVTGGRVPAPIWKRLHEVADRGKQPMSVAGIPLDGTYQRVAAIDPLPAQVIPQTTDETPDISTDTAAEAPDDVKNVLDGMFNLFEKPERQASVRKVAAGRVSKVKSAARPNRVPRNTSLQPEQAAGRKKSNFLEKLFKPRKRVEKKKEKKGLFGF